MQIKLIEALYIRHFPEVYGSPFLSHTKPGNCSRSSGGSDNTTLFED